MLEGSASTRCDGKPAPSPLVDLRAPARAPRRDAARPERERRADPARRDRTDDRGVARLRHGRVNLYRPAWDAFEVTAVHGSEPAARRCSARRATSTPGRRCSTPATRPRRVLRPRGRVRLGASEIVHFVPDRSRRRIENAWRTEDALLVPLRRGRREPARDHLGRRAETGRRPTDDESTSRRGRGARRARARSGPGRRARRAPPRRARAAARGVRHAQRDARGRRGAADRVRGDPERARLRLRVRRAPRPPHGVYATGARVGTTSDSPPSLRARARGAARRRASRPRAATCSRPRRRSRGWAAHHSHRNGRGPHAWTHHWLLVPLVGRHGGVVGFLWVDDPADRLLPTRQLLQALRAFANHAVTALDAATRLPRDLRVRRSSGTQAAVAGLPAGDRRASTLDRRCSAYWQPGGGAHVRLERRRGARPGRNPDRARGGGSASGAELRRRVLDGRRARGSRGPAAAAGTAPPIDDQGLRGTAAPLGRRRRRGLLHRTTVTDRRRVERAQARARRCRRAILEPAPRLR